MARVLRFTNQILVADGTGGNPITTRVVRVRAGEKVIGWARYSGAGANTYEVEFRTRFFEGGPDHVLGTITVSDSDRTEEVELSNVGSFVLAVVTRTVGGDDFEGAVGTHLVSR